MHIIENPDIVMVIYKQFVDYRSEIGDVGVDDRV